MVIPSIDLSDGKAVQLRQGKDKVLERDDPLALAGDFSRFGEIAVIDLDAAMGKGDNEALVARALPDGRMPGGRRHPVRRQGPPARRERAPPRSSSARRPSREAGVNRPFSRELGRADRPGEGHRRPRQRPGPGRRRRLENGYGPRTPAPSSGRSKPFASEIPLHPRGTGRDDGRNGSRGRPGTRRRSTRLPVTAAGGISTADEIGEPLRASGPASSSAWPSTRGRFRLPTPSSPPWIGRKAAASFRRSSRTTASQVLMLAWSSRESLARTFETGKAWFYSRSRKRLWMKGETSGNVQEFVRVRTDCDGDTILLTVRPRGPGLPYGKVFLLRGQGLFVRRTLATSSGRGSDIRPPGPIRPR